jgi:hypothetical protein
LVDRLTFRPGDHKTLTLEHIEQIEEDGKYARHERVVMLTDMRARVNTLIETGKLNEKGEFVAELSERHINDGTKSVMIDYNYDPLRGEKQRTGKHVHVDVNDVRNVRPFHRWTPFSAQNANFVSVVRKAQEEKRPIEIAVDPQDPDRLHVRILSPLEKPGSRPSRLEYVVNWPKAQVVGVHSDSPTGRRWDCTLSLLEFQPGVWLPFEGVDERGEFSITAPQPQGPPKPVRIPEIKRTFKVVRAVYDDPDFPADAFVIKLKPGWFVRDTQKKVEYKVGGKELINEEIETAVAEAKKEMAKPEYKTPVQEAMEEAMAEQTRERVEPAKNRLTEYLIYANVAGLILIVSIVAWRRLRRRP